MQGCHALLATSSSGWQRAWDGEAMLLRTGQPRMCMQQSMAGTTVHDLHDLWAFWPYRLLP